MAAVLARRGIRRIIATDQDPRALACARENIARLHGGMNPDFFKGTRVQEAVAKVWPEVTTENLAEVSDIAGYREEFLRLFGFGLPGVDYRADTSPDVYLPSA